MTVSIGPRSWAHEYAELPIYIYLDGEIDASAPKRLSQALSKVPDRPGGIHIVLNSRGGNLIAAMDLGRIIRKSGATTTVGVSDLSQPELLPVKGECFSACSLAFLGGSYRYFIEGLAMCNGQLKPDTFLSHFPIKFPLKIQWCFIT